MKEKVLEQVRGMHQDRLDEFHKIAYEEGANGRTWGGNYYCGRQIWKWPCDMTLYHELIWELKPELIIETGTHQGASALFFAHQLDQLGYGRVVTVDLLPYRSGLPQHPRIAYVTGRTSIDDSVLGDVEQWLEQAGGPIMVVLDSDHAKEHVIAELNQYHELVSPGSFLVLEDTNVNGHPVYPEHGPGPYEALEEWLPQHPEFKVDQNRADKYLFSFHTWLRKRRL